MSDSEPDFAKLIPDITRWNNGDGIDIGSWTRCSGSVELAIGYSRLFRPRFTEHDQCVLFVEFSPKTYLDFMKACNGDRRSVEAVMNHRHIVDHFVQYGSVATTEQIIHLGRTLKEIWQTKLAHDFPNRKFEVSFSEGPFDDLIDYQITFWQA